jgi:hypothetical protein
MTVMSKECQHTHVNWYMFKLTDSEKELQNYVKFGSHTFVKLDDNRNSYRENTQFFSVRFSWWKSLSCSCRDSTTSYRPNYPLGLKPSESIGLLAPDQTICALLGQSKIAKLEIQSRVALPPLTLQAIPNLQEDFPTNQRLYRVVLVAS